MIYNYLSFCITIFLCNAFVIYNCILSTMSIAKYNFNSTKEYRDRIEYSWGDDNYLSILFLKCIYSNAFFYGVENDSFLNILLISRYLINPDIYYYFRSYNDIEGEGGVP